MKNATLIFLVLSVLSLPAFSQNQTRSTSSQTQDTAQKKIIDDYAKYIPEDKKLDSAWVKSLTERETSRPIYTATNNQLKYIGMPVGGLTCGTVYLGGDGKLWLWEIFNRQHEGIRPINTKWRDKNRIRPRDGARYVNPLQQQSAFEQGFALRLKTANGEQIRSLDIHGFKDIGFSGSYPLANITYADPACPLIAKLTAYSPFIPLNADDSSLPATILEYTLTNNSNTTVGGDLFGWTENPVGLDTAEQYGVAIPRETRQLKRDNFIGIEQTANDDLTKTNANSNPDRIFADFEGTDYGDWKVEGTAFGSRPQKIKEIPQGEINVIGTAAANSFTVGPGENFNQADAKTGKLTSPDFTISHPFICFMLGGGKDEKKLCINLVIDGKTVRSSTGKNENAMTPEVWNISEFKGKKARIEIIDNATGGWGHITVDDITFANSPINWPLAPDYGNLSLILLKPANSETFTHAGINVPGEPKSSNSPGVGAKFELKPGESKTVVFAYTWYFPNLKIRFYQDLRGRYYQTKFKDSTAVADYLASNYERLSSDTKLWVNTWYDSTLPYWLLDRSLITLDCLATETSYRFKNGQFWGWEGVGACQGTCTHVWHYAQSIARLFPELSRNIDSITYFGISQHKDGGDKGGVSIRSEDEHWIAADGQCGVILEAYREHLMSANNDFLKSIWPQVKEAMQYLFKEDANGDGMLEGRQHNTLDANWYGKVPTIATLYLAALRATKQMALTVGDHGFAKQCSTVYAKGQESIKPLFRDDLGYFVQIEDPAHTKEIGTGIGCYIDQVLGQWWAWQLDLGHIADNEQVSKALTAIWTHNYVPDTGVFRNIFKEGRPYAVEGERGTIMCTWPNGGLRPEFKQSWTFGYFNECMTGFEYDYAASLVYDGQIEKGLAVMRSVHDRYSPVKRNPFNEIECSDHYARAMSSYSIFLAVSGFQYNGPKGELSFAPRVHPENFLSAFVTAEGWGSFSQKINGNTLTANLQLKHGKLSLNNLTLNNSKAGKVSVKLDGKAISSSLAPGGQVKFPAPLILNTDQYLEVTLE